MKKYAITTLLALSACSAPIQPSILGFDGSVVKVGIVNIEQQLVSAQQDRVKATQVRADQFCKTKGFQKATYQQEVFDNTYMGPKFNSVAFLCE